MTEPKPCGGCGQKLKEGWVYCPKCGEATRRSISKKPIPGALIELRTKAKAKDNIFLYITTEAGTIYFQYEVADMGFVDEVKRSSYFEERANRDSGVIRDHLREQGYK